MKNLSYFLLSLLIIILIGLIGVLIYKYHDPIKYQFDAMSKHIKLASPQKVDSLLFLINYNDSLTDEKIHKIKVVNDSIINMKDIEIGILNDDLNEKYQQIVDLRKTIKLLENDSIKMGSYQ